MKLPTTTSFVSLLLFVNIVRAGWLASAANQNCVYACQQTLTYVHFSDEPKTVSRYAPQCSSQLRVKSLFFCSTKYCPEDDIQPGLAGQNQSCLESTKTHLPTYSDIMAEVPLINDTNSNITIFNTEIKTALTTMAIPSPQLFDNMLATATTYYNSMSLARTLTYVLYAYWATVILIGITYRLATHFTTHPIFGRESQHYLLIPAIFNSHHKQPLFLNLIHLPTRLQLLPLILYLLLHIIFLLPNYTIIPVNIFFGGSRTQLGQEISDRAANLAMANLPILFLFGFRNDPFLWLTGWSYSTFNSFHRWTAWVTLGMMVIHAVCQTLEAVWDGEGAYAKDLAKEWFQYGIAAITIFGTVIGTSTFFRRRFYDAWLVMHIVLAAGLLCTVFKHLIIWEGNWFNPYIWACVAMWGFDRVLRLGRILVNSRGLKKATATFDDSTDAIRLDVTDHIRRKSVTGHSYYFVYIPGMLGGWQNHPFSLCTWTPTESDGSVTNSLSKELQVSSPAVVSTTTKHTFLIRPQTGFTHRLREKLLSQNQDAETNSDIHCASLRILVEGPYGAQHNLSKHSLVLMVVGGSGISAMVTYAHSILLGNPKSTVIHLVWAVKDLHLAEDILDKELSAVVGHPKLRLDLYETGKSSIPSSPASEEMNPISSRQGTIRSCSVYLERPNVADILTLDRNATSRDLGVICCGPPAMADAVRRATVDVLRSPGPPVAFYDESFGW